MPLSSLLRATPTDRVRRPQGRSPRFPAHSSPSEAEPQTSQGKFEQSHPIEPRRGRDFGGGKFEIPNPKQIRNPKIPNGGL